MAARGAERSTETPLAQLGNVQVSKFETATGARLRLRRLGTATTEAYFDPLELEGLTRVRHKPIRVLPAGDLAGEERRGRSVTVQQMEPLQNEFALVGVGLARGTTETGLLIRDMNAGQTVLLTESELEALLGARHMDFAPLVDTSDLIAIPEPDIDEG